ncbi:MAG: cobyric acid synthase [Duncaniella sp.]|nr:cobyric acid synthase [Duncaniella sp.]
MKLVFIRHTSVAVPKGVCYGQTDVGLADSFSEEAGSVKARLDGYKFDAVYSSPLSRCTRLAAYCGYGSPLIDRRLMEMNFGEWEMMPFDAITDPRLQEWFDDYLNVAPTGGESSMEQRKRFLDFIDEIGRQHTDDATIGLFTHGGIIIHALATLGGQTDEEAFGRLPQYGEVVEITLTPAKRLKPIMLAGTGSDVGKSLIATGLCRIFRQDGYHPAPFKAQNMALNSYATPDGLEIGRAQAVQAEAAGVECSTDMNPILLKPSGDHTSQVVLNGRAIGNMDAYGYYRKEGRGKLREAVRTAFDRLAARYNPIVMEGAGSISEINLRESDLVNMPMVRYAGADVIIVADIDRGGVFASAYGSIMLQDEEDRRRIKGIIVNKFRGDMRLFDEGRRMMEEICGVPVLGVVPYSNEFHIEEEDSVGLRRKASAKADGKVNVAVVLLRHISNFTDFDVLERHPQVNLFYAADAGAVADADIVILPGSKSTLSDLCELRRSGLAQAVVKAHRDGKTVIGICGGYQMMGLEVCDPDGVEGPIERLPGLGLLPVRTTLSGDKVTRRVSFRFLDDPALCSGYEIHVGRSVLDDGAKPLNVITDDGKSDGCMADERCFGSYIHGLLDNATVIDRLLSPYIGVATPGEFDYAAYKERQYDLLADHIRKYVDIDRLYSIMKEK